LPKKITVNYVDNAKFLAALKEYRADVRKAKKAKKPAPQIPEYVGECFLKIATHLSSKPNFMNYTFRDDMISDGIENCLVYIHCFDPTKSSNPFGYFTQVIYFAFIRRIQREKKHTYIKYKLVEKAYIDGGAHVRGEHGQNPQGDSNILKFDNVSDFINRYDDYTSKRAARRKQAKTIRDDKE
jgi:hypothetical protein